MFPPLNFASAFDSVMQVCSSMYLTGCKASAGRPWPPCERLMTAPLLYQSRSRSLSCWRVTRGSATAMDRAPARALPF